MKLQFRRLALTAAVLLAALPLALTASPVAASGGSVTPTYGFVYHVFETLLNRPPEPQELSVFNDSLNGGATAKQIAESIVSSREYRTLLIDDVYTKYLRVHPDAAKVAALLNLMHQAQSSDILLPAFLGSPEYYSSRAGSSKSNWVDLLYQGVVRRKPNRKEKKDAVAQLNHGVTRRQVATTLLATPEATEVIVRGWDPKFLDRPAGSTDFTAAENLRSGGASLDQIEGSILGSPEYEANIVRSWVSHVYGALLSRSPSGQESSYFVGAVMQGNTAPAVVSAILNSDEYLTDAVSGWFHTLLRRAPASGEANGFVSAVHQGATYEQEKAVIMGSQEYFDRAGDTNAGFVTQVYNDVLARKPSQQEIATWVNEIGNSSRTAVAQEIELSTEALSLSVRGWFETYLGRQPSSSSVSNAVSSIQGGTATDESIIATLIGSDEYFNRD